jgi:hypothetical protein
MWRRSPPHDPHAATRPTTSQNVALGLLGVIRDVVRRVIQFALSPAGRKPHQFITQIASWDVMNSLTHALTPSMDTPHTRLAVYLNDHLAGAVSALEILETLEQQPDAPDLNRFAAELRTEIAEDRDELERLMCRADIAQSTARRAAAWISEKAVELKVRVDDPNGGSLRIFELIEIVALGIDGKRALWAALATAAAGVPALKGVDYSRLSERADAQRQTTEVRRLQWATTALSRRSSP